MPDHPLTPGAAFDRAVAIMHRLRAPDGCPWDREQTFDSIRPYTIEETYEVLEAIGNRDWPGLREELGDLLLQVLFYAEMAGEQGSFNLTDVLTTLAEKLVRRHPHVFEDAAGARMNAQEALGRWDEVKAQEKRAAGASPAPKSRMAGMPKDLPALSEAGKIGARAAQVGFDWPNVAGVLAKLEEELAELRAEMESGGARSPLEAELGDVFFTLANLARHLQLEPESALKHANRKFRVRFQAMEAAATASGRSLDQHLPEELDQLWRAAKITTAEPPRA